MKKIVVSISIVIAALLCVTGANASPMLPNLDYTGLAVPGDCDTVNPYVCDAFVTGVTYEDGTSAPPSTDSILNATVRFDFQDPSNDIDDIFSIFDTSGTYFQANIDWTQGSIVDYGFLSIVNPEYTANLYNVVINTGLGSNFIAEIEDDIIGNGGVSATYLSITDNGNDTLNISGKLVPTPEPGTLMLLGSGLAGVGFYTRRRLKK